MVHLSFGSHTMSNKNMLGYSFKLKFKFKKLYKYRMETEILEGLYVPWFIFNSYYTYNILFCDNTG